MYPPARVLKLLITDMDGTLFFTEEANFRAYAQAFAEVGVTLGKEAYAAAFGLRFDRMVEAVAPSLGASERAHVKAAKTRYYKEAFGLVEVNHTLLDLLRAMRQSGRTVALATTSSKQNALPLLEHFGAHADFDHALFGEDVAKGKPDPECYATLITRVGVLPSECLVFEDSDVGVAAATAAGASVLRVTR